MAPEIKNIPSEQSQTDDNNEHYRPIIEANADYRAGFTRRSFEAIGKSLTKFLAEIKNPPYNIEIDENDDKSLAYGIFCFQRLLGPPETENDFIHDGMCGPATLRKYEDVNLHGKNTSSLSALRESMPPSDTMALRAPVSTKEQALDVPLPPAPESHETLPETYIGSWLFVGDSLTVGMKNTGVLNGAIEPQEYDKKTWRDKGGKTHVSKKGISVGGKQTPAMLEALQYAAKNNELNDGKGMVVWGGINDIGSARSVQSIIESLTKIYKFAAQHNMKIVACTLPDWKPSKETLKEYDRRWKTYGKDKYPFTADETVERIHAVNDWIRNQATSVVPQAQLQIVDLNTELKNNPEKYHYNEANLHYPTKGSIAIAEYITSQAKIERQTTAVPKV